MERNLNTTTPEKVSILNRIRGLYRWWLILLCFTGLPVYADIPKPVLHWCLDHFPRFHEFHGRNKPTGPSVAVMEELAKRAGFTLQYSERTPVARCFRQMENGESDLMINLNFTEDRAEFMHMIPYSETIPETLYLRADDPRFIDQLSQLSSLVLVTVRNYSFYNPALLAMFEAQPQQRIEVDSIAAGFDLLNKGRVDGLIVPTQSSLEVIRNQPKLHYKFRKAALTFKFPTKRYINIGLSKKSKHLYLKEKIVGAINAMQQDGTVTRLYDQQLPQPTFLMDEATSHRQPQQTQ